MTTAIGPVFRCPAILCKPQKNRKMRVFECDCGAIYAAAVSKTKPNGTFQACDACVDEENSQKWRKTLRERLIRSQIRFFDRTGKKKCVQCGFRRASQLHFETRGMCRECYANSLMEIKQPPRIDGYTTSYLRGTDWKHDPSPLWENVIRMIEDA